MEDNTRYKIILVDDNLATLNQGKALLQSIYKVYTFQSPITFFENIEGIEPDLILLDVEMPDMDGFETIEKLKATPRYKDIPVIFLTAKSDEESEKKGFLLGAVDYITKPFSAPLLQKRISNQILYTRVQHAVKEYSDNIEKMTTEISNEMHKAEVAEMASRAKTQFLVTMSHEIRTPMNSIMGFAELALNTPDSGMTPQVKDYLRKIFDNAKWLLHIIQDVLDISKIESGKMELENIPFKLNNVFSRCQSVILPSIIEKKLDLRLYLEPLDGKVLLGDPQKLYQALINLLSNAVKFTNTGTIKLSSQIKKSEQNKALIYFEIQDTGIGMTSEQIDKVFDPFVQGDSSMTRNFGGAGLGLSIVRNIVEMMGGKITVESTPGKGSKFSFEIEFETKDASEYMPENQFETIAMPDFSGGLVLVCDDNYMNQEVVSEHLARVRLKTVEVKNGKEAVEAVNLRAEKGEKPFDLILMDIFMPVMDGLEAAAKINAMNTGTPIVAMTANVVASELEKYKNSGMPECLGKPFTSQELWRVLLKYLTPVTSSNISPNDQYDEALKNKLSLSFIKQNKDTFNNITNAINDGDIELAHRLAHSLKTNAGQIGESRLQQAAAEAEGMLANGKNNLTEEKLSVLKNEFETVIKKLISKYGNEINNIKTKTLSNEETIKLFEKLQDMLENNKPECIDLIDEISAIPGTEKLRQHIENLDFEEALILLKDLQKN